MDRPRWARILTITDGSMMPPTMPKAPPQHGVVG